MLWFVPQTGVLLNTNSERVQAYLMSSGYLNETYILVNRMLLVSRRFVPRPTKAAQVGTLDLKNVCLRFPGKYSTNQLRSKLIFILVMFPGQGCYHNCSLCWSCCELKIQTMHNFQSPAGKKCLPSVRELSFLLTRVKLGPSPDSAFKTLHTHVRSLNRTV